LPYDDFLDAPSAEGLFAKVTAVAP
jgi:hypothetical protein